MKPKKMKKLVLSKKTISDLSPRGMNEVNGGIYNPTFVRPDGTSCELPCDGTVGCVTQTCPPITGDSAGPDVCGFCPPN